MVVRGDNCMHCGGWHHDLISHEENCLMNPFFLERSKLENKSMSKQIFGYTPPGPNPGENYVRYLMAFEEDDASVTVAMRDENGKETRVNLGSVERADLCQALAAPKPA